MKTIKTNWTNNEFKAYILLYAANADYVVSETEKDIIEELIDKKQLHKISTELKYDNDIQSIKKIEYCLKKFNYSKEEKEILLEEIKNLFLSDGDYNQLEKIMYHFFEKIFSA